jgi:hypothetical protein
VLVPALQVVDESFFAAAPQRLEHTFHIPRPAADVWAELVSDQPLHWCRIARGHWTSPRPFGVGATKNITLLGLLTVKERYFLWEEGVRKAFYVSDASLPLFSAVAEDYVVESRGDAASTLTWRVAIKPSALGAPGAPANKLVFWSLWRDTASYFHAT